MIPDNALNILIAAYDELHTMTYTSDEIESILIRILIRKGIKSASRYVRMFLDD